MWCWSFHGWWCAEWWIFTDISDDRVASIFKVSSWICYTLKIEVVCFSLKSVTLYQSAQQNIAEHLNFHPAEFCAVIPCLLQVILLVFTNSWRHREDKSASLGPFSGLEHQNCLWVVPPDFKDLRCLCKGKKNTNEILEHYFLGWSVIHEFLVLAGGRETLTPLCLEYYSWACWIGAVFRRRFWWQPWIIQIQEL